MNIARADSSLKLPTIFFMFASIMLAAMAAVTPWALPLIAGPFSSMQLLAFMHLMTIGFIASIVIGASYQLVPVVLEAKLQLHGLAWFSLGCHIPGVVLFVSALYLEKMRLVVAGGLLVGLSIGSYALCIIATCVRAERAHAYRYALAMSAVLAAAGMVCGVLLALNKQNGELGAASIRWLGAHVVLMVAGWVGLTFITVASKLIAMFTLTEQRVRSRHLTVQSSLLVLGTIALACGFHPAVHALLRVLGAWLIVAGLLAFAWLVQDLSRHRIRRAMDVHAPFALASLAWLIAGSVAAAVGISRETPPGNIIWPLVIWMILWGGFGTAIQGFLVKIATFLVWLCAYAPIAGTRAVPKLNDMYQPRPVYTGFAAWTIGVFAFLPLARASQNALLLTAALPLTAGVALHLITLVTIFRHVGAGRLLARPSSVSQASPPVSRPTIRLVDQPQGEPSHDRR